MHRRAFGPVALYTIVSVWSPSLFGQTSVATPIPPAVDAEVVVDAVPKNNTDVDAKSAIDAQDTAAVAASATAPIPSPTSYEGVSVAPPKPEAPSVKPPIPAQPEPAADSVAKDSLVEINGYAQLQFESHADSEDQLRQGGTLLNQNRFLVRRIRVELSRRYSYSGYLVEIDGNTTNGPSLSLHRAEGSIFYTTKPGQPALIELAAGLLKLPFGYETPESSRSRWFMERTTASRAFFPNEVDVGARLHGAWRFLRYGVALTNGEPKGTKGTNFQLQDPNRAKDITLRVGADVPSGDGFRISGGVSYLAGKGFHAGDDATKSRITWTDNVVENGTIDNGELNGVPGTVAVPAENFRRWAVGTDLQTKLKTGLGWSTVFVEAVAAVNLDRGLYVANPTRSTPDAREFGWHLGFTQEITRYATIGFRYDSYNPDSDLIDKRGGQFLPNDQTIATYSPLVGLAIPDRARLVFQYDFVRDSLARDKTGVPVDLSNDQWTLRLQVNL